MLKPFMEMIAAIKNGNTGVVKKWSVADCTPEVISKMASNSVFVIPRSTVKADEIDDVRTFPSAEKNITVVATKMITFVLSLIESRSGELLISTLFFCFGASLSIWLFLINSNANRKKMIFAMCIAANSFQPDIVSPKSSVPTKPKMNIGPGA